MPPQVEQKIEVKSTPLHNLMSNMGNGTYRVPQFQREFVWNKPRIIDLLDSIYQEFPIGSFFLWDAGADNNHLFRQLVGLGIPEVKHDDRVFFILDGQQRITSLFVTLNGMSVNGTDYSKVCFDLEKQEFRDRAADGRRYVSVSKIWGPESMLLSRHIPEEYVAAYDRCWRTLQTYPVSIVEVRDKNLDQVCKIFQRINQAGKRLDRFDLIAAMTFDPEFDLREKFATDIQEKLTKARFGELQPYVVTQLLALLVSGLCTERYEYGLKSEQIRAHWQAASSAILLSLETLRSNMGVVNLDYVPYNAFITLLAYYFAVSGNRSLPADHMEWVKRWFWRSSFGKRYSTASPTLMGRDRELFDQLIAGKNPELDIPVMVDVADLVRTRMTWRGSATRNAFLCLLALCEPRHLGNAAKIDLLNGDMTGFSKAEKHHIFPKAFLDRAGETDADVHSVPNFCFLTAELNKLISDRAPSEYIPELKKLNPDFETAAASNLLPYDTDSGIPQDDYARFLEVRGRMIREEVNRLCGGITTPRKEERQAAVEALERRWRDLIDHVLSREAGENYWTEAIPEAVRADADKRIAEDLRKHPDRDPNELSPPANEARLSERDGLPDGGREQEKLGFVQAVRAQSGRPEELHSVVQRLPQLCDARTSDDGVDPEGWGDGDDLVRDHPAPRSG